MQEMPQISLSIHAKRVQAVENSIDKWYQTPFVGATGGVKSREIWLE